MIESVDTSVIHSIAQLHLKFSASEARVQVMNARLQDMNGNVQQVVADLKRRRIREAVQERDRDDEAERVAKKQKAEISFLKLDPDAQFMQDTADILIRDSITGKQILAHRLVLASRSPVFKRKFEMDTKVLQMDLDTVTCAVIRFCYTAEMEFTKEISVEEVFRVAHYWDIDHLKEICTDEFLKTLSKDNISHILSFSMRYNAKRLYEAASQYVRENFDTTFPIILAGLY
ncbi:unnamed protein product [Calypogeia fissa]